MLREQQQTNDIKMMELFKALDETNALMKIFLQKQDPNPNVVTPVRKRSWWGTHCWPNKRRVVYAHITLITVVLQFTNLIILTLLDVWPRKNVEERHILMASSITMIVLQVLNLFILIFATGRLAKQVIKHSVNNFFLAQSYLATLLLFAGIYTVTYRMDRRSWKFMNENLETDPIQVFALYFKFLFYSISTATLCGSDTALPVDWYNHLFAGTQMLLSFCYFASILGITLAPSTPSTPTLGTQSYNREPPSATDRLPVRYSNSHASRTETQIAQIACQNNNYNTFAQKQKENRDDHYKQSNTLYKPNLHHVTKSARSFSSPPTSILYDRSYSSGGDQATSPRESDSLGEDSRFIYQIQIDQRDLYGPVEYHPVPTDVAMSTVSGSMRLVEDDKLHLINEMR